MGVYVQSQIVPERIESEPWHALYLRTLAFLSDCPLPLMGLRRVPGNRVDRRVYSRVLEHDAGDPGRRHWHTVGDFESMEQGESFVLYADIGYYRGDARSHREEPPEDILQYHLGDDGSSFNVFNAKTQGHAYHTPMLAAAMLIEDAFPLYAFTSGDIDRAQAEQAQAMIEQTLGLQVALPLCVDGERLLERISRYLKGKDAIECFDRLFRGDEDTLFRIAPARELEAWLADALRTYQSPRALGVTGLAMHWLNADRDLATLCRVACLSETGPRFDPTAFAETLAGTWIMVPPEVRSALAPFDRPAGVPDSVHTQLGMALLDMSGFKGRRIRRHIPRDAVVAVLTELFPAQAGPIRDAIDAQAGSITRGLDSVRAPVAALDQFSREESETGDGHSFLSFQSVASMTERQRALFNYFAYTANRLLGMLPEQLPESATWTHAECIGMLERGCDAHGITLTEDAWAWIDAEQDRDLLAMLISFAAMNQSEQRFWNMRLALFERRAFAQAVLAASRDQTLIDEIAAADRQA